MDSAYEDESDQSLGVHFGDCDSDDASVVSGCSSIFIPALPLMNIPLDAERIGVKKRRPRTSKDKKEEQDARWAIFQRH